MRRIAPEKEPPPDLERPVCEAFAASLGAIASRLGGRAVPDVGGPASLLPSLDGYPEARATYGEMGESLDRLEEALLNARRA